LKPFIDFIAAKQQKLFLFLAIKKFVWRARIADSRIMISAHRLQS